LRPPKVASKFRRFEQCAPVDGLQA
jgi:hypothetical protein